MFFFLCSLKVVCRFYLLTLKTFEKGVASTQASANLTAITLGIRKDRGQLHTAPSTTHQAPPKILDYWEIVDFHLLISQIFCHKMNREN